MAHIRIAVSAEDMEALQDIQFKVLAYLLDPTEANALMGAVLSKYINPLPTDYDQTEITLAKSKVFSFGDPT